MEDNTQEIEKIIQEESEEKDGGFLAFIRELIKITLISLAIILPVRYFLIKPFYVNGASMEPTYYNHEYLIVNEISYRFANPQRGDVIVFKYPVDPSEFFIKRIIGLPGEHVVISVGKVAIYNSENPEGKILDEEYLKDGTMTSGEIDVVLKEDEYFVLGDNRGASLDSRRFGTLNKEKIIGKTWLRMLPFERIGVLNNFSFNF
jgi:signal peptidase I